MKEFRNFRSDVTHEELKEAAKPLHQMLCEYGDPYTTIVVTQAFVTVVQDEISAPLPVPD